MRETVFNYIECDYNRWRCHSGCAALARNSLKTIASLRAVSTLRGSDQTSDHSNHTDAYCYKIFRCNQKYCYALLLAFHRSVSLSAHVSSTGKSFIQLYSRGNYREGSCCPPVLVISGTIAIHGLCTDCPDSSEPVPIF